MRQFDIEKIEREKPVPAKRPKRRASTLPYFLGLLLGLVLVFGALQIQGNKTTKEQPIKESITQEETAQTETETIPKTPPKQEEQTTSSPAPTLDKTKVSIQILNGNGIRGDAYKTKVILEKDGFKVATYGNASSFKYQSTLVYYKEGQEEAGKGVEETLKKNGKVTSLEKSSNLTKYDVLVIVGKK
jgi:cytoskeletal protein RodZ